MRVALVGPTHPAKGGVATHTTALAHRLQGAGHDVTLVTWSHLYPSALYPGELAVPDGEPDVPPFPRTVRALSWARPDTWVRTGRRLRSFDVVVVVHVVAAVAPAHLALLAATRSAHGPRRVVLAHNVLPHEPHVGARRLVAALLRVADAVLVHSTTEAAKARGLGARDVAVAALPPHLPGGPPAPRAPYDGPTRLLALGMVRDYKGVDLALQAVGRVPGVTMTVSGELWGEAGRRVQALAGASCLSGRVRVEPGYVPASRLAGLLAEHDVLTLTYRSATASQNVLLAHQHGVPVLATDVGTFAEQLSDGVDGLVVPAGDEAALVAAVARLADRSFVDRLRAGVRPPDQDTPWTPYLRTLESLMSERPVPPGSGSTNGDDSNGDPHRSPGHPPDESRALGGGGQVAAPPGGRALAVAKRAAEYALWARVGVQRRLQDGARRPLPVSVAPTGVLQSRKEWESAVAEARRLRLPLHRDRPKNWDALGAVGAVLRSAGEGGTACGLRVMDAGSARYSPVLPWLRLYGLGDAPESLLGINLEFGAPVSRDGVSFRYGDATATGLPAAGLDAITCMSVIEHGVPLVPFLSESARVLRPGGVLCVSTDYDHDPPDTSGHTAYGGPVHIFGPDEIDELVQDARAVGFELVGDLGAEALAHPERPVHWRRVGLDYTFILLTFRRR